MTGHYVERKGGWDCHGLPVEIAVEQKLGFKSKDDIERYGIAEFNRQCREAVLEHLDGLARADRADRATGSISTSAYYTLDPSYIESVWWALKTMWDRDLLYEGHKVVPYCARCGTALSSHEVAQGYKDVEDPSVYVRFPVTRPAGALREGDALLVWTTTPWTLVSNAAVAVDPDLTYVRTAGGEVLAEALARARARRGRRDRRPLPGPRDARRGLRAAVRVHPGGGLRREGPHRAAGRLRHRRGRHGHRPHRDRVRRGRLPARRRAGARGRQPGAARRHLRRAHRPVRRALGQGRRPRPDRGPARARPAAARGDAACTPTRTAGAAARRCSTTPSRPGTSARRRCATGCWPPTRRSTGTRRTSSTAASASGWRTTSTGRSRASATGARRCPSGAARTATSSALGSLAEVQERSGRELPDPHRPYVDEHTWPCAECGGEMRRVPEVIDVWFDSGSMPFAQRHAPFENEEQFRATLPRRLHLRGDRPDARLVLLAARDLDAAVRPTRRTGRCSASATSPTRRARRCRSRSATSSCRGRSSSSHGADAFRWYFLTSKQPWDGYLFSTETVGESVRQFLLQLWNTYGFYVLYANANDVAEPGEPATELDRWAISRLNATIAEVRERMEDYDATRAGQAIAAFVDELSNWYVRRSRRRFWDGDPAAFGTLQHLPRRGHEAARAVLPFVADAIFENLDGSVAERAPGRLPASRASATSRWRPRWPSRARPSGSAWRRAVTASSRCASRCARPSWSRRATSARRSSGSPRPSCATSSTCKELRFVARGRRARLLRRQAELPLARPALRQADAAGRGGGRGARARARRRGAARRRPRRDQRRRPRPRARRRRPDARDAAARGLPARARGLARRGARPARSTTSCGARGSRARSSTRSRTRARRAGPPGRGPDRAGARRRRGAARGRARARGLPRAGDARASASRYDGAAGGHRGDASRAARCWCR